MTLDDDPNVGVERDHDGLVQSLDHVQRPWAPHSDGLQSFNATQVANQYLQAMAQAYRVPKEVFSDDPTEPPKSTPLSSISFGLELACEIPCFKSTAIMYQQKRGKLPVWDAELSVLVDEKKRVVNSSSTIDPDVPKLEESPDVDKYQDFTIETLRQLLPGVEKSGLVFQEGQGQQRLVFYCYKENDRQADPKELLPRLDLPAVDGTLRDGQYYIVREVLFTLGLDEHDNLTWRALIEVETGCILYLRSLTSCLHGWVFSRDLATRLADRAPKTNADPTELKTLRERVYFPDTVDSKFLYIKGKYAEIKHIENGSSPSSTIVLEFDDDVNTENFAVASAYRHIAKLFRLISELGFPIRALFRRTDFPVPVYHNGLGNQVNARAPANARGNGSGGFRFGRADEQSEVSIAADFRVVAHEFGHALLWNAVGSANFGFAHSPGDSIAAIYCDPGSNAKDRFDTFPWNQIVRRYHNREVSDGWAWDGPKFRSEARDSPQYDREQILSTTLFRLYRALGGDAIGDYDRQVWASRYALYLIIGGISTTTRKATMPNLYVSAMVNADNGTILGYPGGAARKIIRWSFEKQGLRQSVSNLGPVWTPAPPPDVDVYINDGRDGEYDYNPSFNEAPGIWNRRSPDNGTDNEVPNPGVTNYCYVAIKNRGTRSAVETRVALHQSSVAEPRVWPRDFQYEHEAVLDGAISGNRKQTIVAGPLKWEPSQDRSLDGYNLLATVSANGDLSNIDTTSDLDCASGPIDIDRIVPFDNNLAMRHFERPPLTTTPTP